MSKRMLIDATHPEETRVVVLNGSRIEEFDFETSTKLQLKGNIYLAKVTRVEPSLQAAFVEFGGNRHGFLSFNEIHPDYYHLPIADRQALAQQEAREAQEATEGDGPAVVDGDGGEDGNDDRDAEVVSGEEVDEIDRRRGHRSRRYHIQEVIKRRDIMLVQVVKEERGTKGAALTAYLSLAGRYCVLMPNAGRGGGISRKIVNPEDRKHLKAIAAELPVPESMGVILRTAGLARSKAEIKRDFAYLLRLWDNIRELTLKSIAPALIHEDANLIKRSIRDLYTRENEEVLIEGEDGYRMAKQFMRTLIPSHAARVKPYLDRIPLFHRYQVESLLDAMHSPTVHLKSGGYIVINMTEALVSIDVNSGKATRARNIEETATKTNLEAAEEIARQLRLRDLSGLIVIDFIDMDDSKNVRSVERRFKESIKNDRARTQIGRISAFGLLELSRQRLRPSLIEASSQACPYCGGSGHVRSTESTALHVLRAIEEEGIRERSQALTVFVPPAIALYVLNQKRAALSVIEERYGFRVFLASDDSLIPPDYRLERVRSRADGEAEAEAETETETETEAGRPEAAGEDAEQADRRPRRQRSRRRKADDGEAQPVAEAADAGTAEAQAASEGDGEAAGTPRKRRRRGKRGGRRRRGAAQTVEAAEAAEAAEHAGDAEAPAAPEPAAPEPSAGEPFAPEPVAEEPSETAPEPVAEEPSAGEPFAPEPVAEEPSETAAEPEAAGETPRPKRARRSRRKKIEADAAEAADAAEPESAAEAPPAAEKPKRARRRKQVEAEPETAKPKRPRRRKKAESTEAAPPAADTGAAPDSTPGDLGDAPQPVTPAGEVAPAAVIAPAAEESRRPPRRGWWQRLT